MPVLDVIRRRVKKYNLTRRGIGALVDGISTPAASIIIKIKAHQQPMTAKELRNLPPGQNAGEWRNVWTENDIRITDQIDICGLTFTVQRVTLWEDGPFFVANANRTQDTI